MLYKPSNNMKKVTIFYICQRLDILNVPQILKRKTQ